MYSTDSDLLEYVDENDNVLGVLTRAEIHQFGYLHRAAHIFVFNTSGEIYIQLRSKNKDRHPLKLDSSAAGHVDPGETYEQTAKRELYEELGLTDPVRNVLFVKSSAMTDNEHVALFVAMTQSSIKPNPLEISWGDFLSPNELTAKMSFQPEDFVPAFIYLWNAYQELQST
jgi:isopentenyldiphosphate isomerase